MRLIVSLAAATLLATTAGGAFAASAVQKECSTKYQAAKSAGTLNGMTYNQYYSQCAKEERAEKAGGTTTPTATAAPATAPAAPSAPKAPTATAAPAPATIAPAPTTATTGGAVFPTAISPEFSSLKPHQARMKTCAAQWQKDKADNTTGGMKWNPKGGGYYSECNKRLKG